MLAKLVSSIRSYIIQFYFMEEALIDISKIPRLEVGVNNNELQNCIRELHFHSNNLQKQMSKIRKEVDIRPTEPTLTDAFMLINSAIEIDSSLLKQIATRTEPKLDPSALKNSSNKMGYKIGQMSDVMKYFFERIKQLEKKVEQGEAANKTSVAERFNSLQSQFDDFRKAQAKQNRTLSDSIQISLNSYEEKLREVESKTLWQINDCQTRLKDRVNQQFVRDAVRQSQTRVMTKVKESMIRSNIDPQKIDHLENRCLKVEKELELKMIECYSRMNQIKDNVAQSLTTKKEFGQEKLETEKKVGNMQVQLQHLNRKINHIETEERELGESAKLMQLQYEQTQLEIARISKIVSNLKLSDDFLKLIQHIDPHKICEIDTSIVSLNERDLKIQKEVDSIKRFVQKLRQKTEICNLLAPNQSSGKLDKQATEKIVSQQLAANASLKKIGTIEGQLFELKNFGDMISQLNKRISKMQKQFDIQTVIYALRGLEEYVKKQLLIMNNKIAQIESAANQAKRRPISARKLSESKITSSVSYKKLVPVDCISCFQNPIGERTPQNKFLSRKY